MATQDATSTPAPPRSFDLRTTIVRVVREAMTATLATIDAADGGPYASLVEVATTDDGRPLLLLSGLARHTRNLDADPRASLLVDRRHAAGALALERATYIGRAARTACAHDRARFLRRHPAAAGYVDFGDFGFWTVEPRTVHVIAGFGRIREVAASEVLTPRRPGHDAVAAAAVEAACIAAVAAVLSGCRWSVAGVDDEGVDLVATPPAAAGRRIAFPAGVTAADPSAVARVVVERLVAEP